ncbi:MAG TPA: presqualene diphosphate synthase HpnD [Rhizomicrobium sp.]|jgi:phytoene synthase|nr:presqualene diphosphate synthase HpnD [Rhizomicrobium sp.]
MTATPQEILAVERKARGSSFYTAMRLMPREEREAMFAIYAFCRMVDDIADDGVGTRADRHDRLTAWRRDLDVLYGGGPAAESAFLKDAVRRYGLRKEDFNAVIDGMEMDVHADIVAPELPMLDLYCDRVASAVGRLSIKVFGMDEEPGFELAHHLGRALQLTNILRDLDEDAAIGRLYLAREHLEEAGIRTREPVLALGHPRIDIACRACARLAHEHYAGAEAVMRRKPKGRIRTPRLMGAVYSAILSAMESEGWNPPRRRVSLPMTRLAAIVLRYGIAG